MATQWEWADFWSVYKVNPSIMDDEMWRDFPQWIRQKSTRVQISILTGAPESIVKSLLPFLTFDCQIKLLYSH